MRLKSKRNRGRTPSAEAANLVFLVPEYNPLARPQGQTSYPGVVLEIKAYRLNDFWIRLYHNGNMLRYHLTVFDDSGGALDMNPLNLIKRYLILQTVV